MGDEEFGDSSALVDEFTRLQREYRNVEQNRRAYTEESQSIIKRQEAAIAKLRREQELLNAEMGIEKRMGGSGNGTNKTIDAQKISSLEENGDAYTQKIAAETKNLEELNRAIKVMNSKILNQKKKMGGINASQDSHKMAQKQIQILENRLEKALVKYNEALTQNKSLRDKIDGFKKEREAFDNIYSKLDRDILEKKKIMAEALEQSNRAYENRDQVRQEITAIERQIEKENDIFQQKIEDLNTRIESERVRKQTILREQMRLTDMESSNPSPKSIGSRMDRGNSVNKKLADSNMQIYDEAFRKIQVACKINNIESLVSTFASNESRKNELAESVNRQNTELQLLQEEVAGLKREEIRISRRTDDEVSEHMRLLDDLEVKLTNAKTTEANCDSRHHELSKLLTAVKLAIESLYMQIGADQLEEAKKLKDISGDNMLQYLGLIEVKADEILSKWEQYSATEN